jgi:predicted transcriptional regulator
MFYLVLIENGEFVYRDNHGNLHLIPEDQKDKTTVRTQTNTLYGGYRHVNVEVKIAAWKHRDRIHQMFTKGVQEVILHFSDEKIKLNKDTKCLFEILERDKI